MSSNDKASIARLNPEAYESDVAALANLSAYIASEARRLGIADVADHAEKAAKGCRRAINDS